MREYAGICGNMVTLLQVPVVVVVVDSREIIIIIIEAQTQSVCAHPHARTHARACAHKEGSIRLSGGMSLLPLIFPLTAMNPERNYLRLGYVFPHFPRYSRID